MRVGQNPAKFIEHVPQPERVTVAIITYIPFLSGYYAESLDVLKVCLESLWQNTPEPYDLMVFDNASCPEVQEYLLDAQRQGRIQYLILSDKNIGKGGAWNVIFSGAPGEFIAYADSDICFYPGWLEETLKILEAYPNVGMVTARPIRTSEEFYTSSLEWARRTPGVELVRGQFLDWETFQEHNDSMGVPPETAREWFDGGYEWRAVYGGVCVHLGAGHFQFAGRKEILLSITPFNMDRPMGQVRSLDQMLNEAGYLRLCTCDPLIKHLGNRLSGEPAQRSGAKKANLGLRRRLLNLPVIRRVLLKIYNHIFRLYYS